MALRKPTAGGAPVPSLQPNPAQRAHAAGPEPRTLTLPASAGGAGGMSAEDRAAIAGQVIGDMDKTAARVVEPVVRYSDAYEQSAADTEDSQRAFDDQGAATPLGELVKRLATLEHNFEQLEAAMEAGFASIKTRANVVPLPAHYEHGPVLPASRAEEAAYTGENFRRYKERDPAQPQFDGIEEWRRAGRPGL